MEKNMRIDDLQLGGLSLMQDKTAFCFGVDAVLLADFVKIKKGKTVIDLGCGNGIIPLLLSAKTRAVKITGLEIQPEATALARENVRRNGLEERISITEGDLRHAAELFGKAAFDYVVSNPPYKKKQSGLASENPRQVIARHEVLCELEDVIKSASELLAPMGKFFMIHRPERLAEIFCACAKFSLEPKQMRMVCPKKDKAPSMVLLEMAKGEDANLRVLPSLYIHNDDGTYTEEIYKIYGRR